MDRDSIIRRGQAAELILKNETAMSALGECEADLFTEWAGTNPNRPEDREAIFRQVKAMELFQAKLEAWAAAGQVERAKIEQGKQDARGIHIVA